MPGKAINKNIIHRFGFRHYQTDGKLQNLLEAVEQAPIETICLTIIDKYLDPPQLKADQVEHRLERAQKVIKKLKKRNFTVHLALPGLLDHASPQELPAAFKLAAQANPHAIWVDDTAATNATCPDHKTILKRAAQIRKSIHAVHPKMPIGLIAAELPAYLPAKVAPAQLAKALNPNGHAMLAQSQGFDVDHDRTEILKAAQMLAMSKAQIADRDRITFLGFVDHFSASGFDKSAEAMQMQINLNLLLGADHIMLDCFDQIGTAPGSENSFLNMQNNRHKFLKKLVAKLPSPYASQAAINYIVPDNLDDWPEDIPPYTAWPMLLWRLGIPVAFIATSAVPAKSKEQTTYILTGHTPAKLTKAQLEHVFSQGALLDSTAAKTLQNIDRTDLIGIKLGKAIRNAQLEIFSDSFIAASNYAYNSVLTLPPVPKHCHSIEPVSKSTRTLTTICPAEGKPNIPGLACFDDIKNNRRAVILPYSMDMQIPPALLTNERQRQFTDLFAWLKRSPLPCYVENSPDLIPLYIPWPKHKSAILALLNISFDWAINSRIRLHRLPVPFKKVRELTEDNKITAQPEIGPHNHRQYQFLQLSPETAVPPMQMTILLLEN